MRTRPLISVIVPIYNVEKYIDDCLKSLVRQTYKNLEILLIDDGSTDGSAEKCDVWAKRDQRIRVIHTENHGVSHARNVGLDAARGDYIGFVDGDDWCDLDMYEKMMNYIQSTRANIHGGGYTLEHLTGSEIALETGQPCVLSARQVILEMFSVRRKPLMIWSLCDKLVERSLIGNLRFDEKLKLSEDQWFFWQLLRKVKRFSYVPQMGYHYRMREGSATHTPPKRENGTYLDAMNRILRDAQDMDAEIQHVLKMKYYQIAIGVMKNIVLSNSHDFDDILQQEQHKLRKNMLACLQELGSLNQKIGTLYFSLPECLVWALRPLLLRLKH